MKKTLIPFAAVAATPDYTHLLRLCLRNKN